jgi:hypothetical protein
MTDIEDLEKEAPIGFLVQNAITTEIGEVYLPTENQNSGYYLSMGLRDIPHFLQYRLYNSCHILFILCVVFLTSTLKDG